MPYRIKRVDIYTPTSKTTQYYPHYRFAFCWNNYSGPSYFQVENDDHPVINHFGNDEWSTDNGYESDIFFYTIDNAIKYLKIIESINTHNDTASKKITYIDIDI